MAEQCLICGEDMVETINTWDCAKDRFTKIKGGIDVLVCKSCSRPNYSPIGDYCVSCGVTLK